MKLTMKKILSISVFILLISSRVAHAVCPVCTVAVGAGLGLAEWLGIDDSISGLWIGALDRFDVALDHQLAEQKGNPIQRKKDPDFRRLLFDRFSRFGSKEKSAIRSTSFAG